MQIHSLSFLNFPIEFNTPNTSNRKNYSCIQLMEADIYTKLGENCSSRVGETKSPHVWQEREKAAFPFFRYLFEVFSSSSRIRCERDKLTDQSRDEKVLSLFRLKARMNDFVWKNKCQQGKNPKRHLSLSHSSEDIWDRL